MYTYVTYESSWTQNVYHRHSSVSRSCPNPGTHLFHKVWLQFTWGDLNLEHFNLALGSGFLGSCSKESACNERDFGSIPGSGKSLAGGNGNSPQYFCLENPMDRGAWRAIIHGVAKSQTWLSDRCFHFFTLVIPKHWNFCHNLCCNWWLNHVFFFVPSEPS